MVWRKLFIKLPERSLEAANVYQAAPKQPKVKLYFWINSSVAAKLVILNLNLN